VNFLVRFPGPRGWRAGVSSDGTVRSSRPRLFEVRGVDGCGGVDVFGGGDWCSDLTDGIGIHLALCYSVSTSLSDKSKSTTWTIFGLENQIAKES
jgi:hypothetical protein